MMLLFDNSVVSSSIHVLQSDKSVTSLILSTTDSQVQGPDHQCQADGGQPEDLAG
jgi:hypothetical protein